MRYEQALRLVFERRKCGIYQADMSWPPCCTLCTCVEDAKQMVIAAQPKIEDASVQHS